MNPQIDHVVIDVQDRMQEALRRYTALGFHITQHRQQDRAAFKRLAVIGPSYVELYGYGEEVPQADRPQTGA